MSALVEFSMSPMGKGASVGDFVARSLDIVDRSGLSYQLTPMGTILEGQWDECMRVVGECFKNMSAEADRISCSIKVDYRAGQDKRMTAKVESVERRLGKPLRKK